MPPQVSGAKKKHRVLPAKGSGEGSGAQPRQLPGKLPQMPDRGQRVAPREAVCAGGKDIAVLAVGGV